MLKNQGPENWSRGRPGLLRARTNSRSVRDTSCGKIREGKNRCGDDVMTPQVRGACGFLFACRWGEGPVTVHKNALHSGKSVHVRKVSPVPGRPLGDDDGVDQRTGGPAGSCSVCSAAARGDAAGPGSRCGNHRCRLGWERSAGSGGFGFGFLLRRFAGAASADVVSSGGVGGRPDPSVRTSGAAAVAGGA